jgi:hypothetical protein
MAHAFDIPCAKPAPVFVRELEPPTRVDMLLRWTGITGVNLLGVVRGAVKGFYR